MEGHRLTVRGETESSKCSSFEADSTFSTLTAVMAVALLWNIAFLSLSYCWCMHSGNCVFTQHSTWDGALHSMAFCGYGLGFRLFPLLFNRQAVSIWLCLSNRGLSAPPVQHGLVCSLCFFGSMVGSWVQKVASWSVLLLFCFSSTEGAFPSFHFVRRPGGLSAALSDRLAAVDEIDFIGWVRDGSLVLGRVLRRDKRHA